MLAIKQGDHLHIALRMLPLNGLNVWLGSYNIQFLLYVRPIEEEKKT